MVKRVLSALLLVFLAVAVAAAQDIERLLENEKLREQLALKENEIRELAALWKQTQREIQLATADREVAASELRRLLLDEKIDMVAVKKTLREGMEIEYRIRLLEIERAVKAREILGERRWAQMQSMLRNLAQRKKQEADDPSATVRPTEPKRGK